MIVDDEPLARDRVRALLAKDKNIEIVAEAGDGKSALKKIQSEKPDLVFLDIQMPVMTGFEVVEALPESERPAIIFVTAFDQYAIDAFEVHALDYLLKPFDSERFQTALNRAKQQIEQGQLHELHSKITKLLTQTTKAAPDRLILKESGRVQFLTISDIDWIEANGNYVKIHAGKESHLFRATMKEMEERLAPNQFRRIHRNVIVNTERIKELKNWFNGEYVAVLTTGKELSVSRRFRKNLDTHL
jgi:two-component system LytT family response regulator